MAGNVAAAIAPYIVRDEEYLFDRLVKDLFLKKNHRIAVANDVNNEAILSDMKGVMEKYIILYRPTQMLMVRPVELMYDDGCGVKDSFYINHQGGKTILHYKIGSGPESSIPLQKTNSNGNFKIKIDSHAGGKKTRKRRNRRLSKRRKSLIRRNYPDFR